MTITLEEAKAHLRIRHADHDAHIGLLVSSADAALQRYAGDNHDPDAFDLKAAQMLLVEQMYYPAGDIEIDEQTGWPVAAAALARPYRLPTVR